MIHDQSFYNFKVYILYDNLLLLSTKYLVIFLFHYCCYKL